MKARKIIKYEIQPDVALMTTVVIRDLIPSSDGTNEVM